MVGIYGKNQIFFKNKTDKHKKKQSLRTYVKLNKKGAFFMIVDFHVHAFSEKVVEKAMANLSEISARAGLSAHTDGTLSGTVSKLSEWGIEKAVIMNIATKPSQQTIVNDWAKSVMDNKNVYCFGSIHPLADDKILETERIKKLGLKGIKLHPEYQCFYPDDKNMMPVYERCAELKLPITFHAGFDPLSPDITHGTPERFLKIHRNFPDLTIILAHLGGINYFDEVEDIIAGCDGKVYLDTAIIANRIDMPKFERIVNKHGADRILFASDCPWDNPLNEINLIEKSSLSAEQKDKIFYKNALSLL